MVNPALAPRHHEVPARKSKKGLSNKTSMQEMCNERVEGFFKECATLKAETETKGNPQEAYDLTAFGRGIACNEKREAKPLLCL